MIAHTVFAITLYHFEHHWPVSDPVPNIAELALVLAAYFEGVKPKLMRQRAELSTFDILWNTFVAVSFTAMYWTIAGWCRASVYRHLAAGYAKVISLHHDARADRPQFLFLSCLNSPLYLSPHF